MPRSDDSARNAPGVAEVRVSGTREDTDTLLALLEAAGAEILSKSAGYPNRRSPGRRVYVLVRLPRPDPGRVLVGRVVTTDGVPVDISVDSGEVRFDIGAVRFLLALGESGDLAELLPVARDLAEAQQIAAEDAYFGGGEDTAGGAS